MTAIPNSETNKKTGSAFGKALDIIGTVIIIAAIVLCLGLTVPKFFGVTGYTVLTGSMEPTIPVGSLVFARYAEPATLEIGDIVVFYDGGVSDIPITHRVIGNQQDEGTITTQGDANPAPDISPIMYPNIIGKVLVHIPFAGRLLAPLGGLPGKLSLCCIILGAMFLSLAGRRLVRGS